MILRMPSNCWQQHKPINIIISHAANTLQLFVKLKRDMNIWNYKTQARNATDGMN